MRYLKIPSTELTVSAISLGTADMGASISRRTAFRLLDQYLEAGGNFIDTAKVYSDWIPGTSSTSEKLIGRWLRSRKLAGRVIIATKGAHPHLHSMHVPRLSRLEIYSDIDASLQHLGLDCIDLYYLHRDDPHRPVQEIIDALHAVQKAGKVRAYACSNWRVERLQAANDYAASIGAAGFTASQVMWNLAVVDAEAIGDPTIVVMDAAMHAYHCQSGLAAIPFSSQANGLFQKMAEGKFERLNRLHRRMYASPENPRRLERALTLARECNLTLSQVVLGYLLAQPFVTIPIIGSRNSAQLADSLSAADVQLTAEQVGYLEGK